MRRRLAAAIVMTALLGASAASAACLQAEKSDQIAEGKISFDYHMRPGVVRKSNAIELMRQVGLEI